MIIKNVKTAASRDIQDYCWSRISKYLNIEYTAGVIAQLHGLGVTHEKNAKNQAEQIRFCLLQAREYFKAADAVSLATRPVLLYYGVMSMALSEVLLKQNADSRLEKLRQNHGCHGLTLAVAAVPKIQDVLSLASSNLVAKIQVDKVGAPRGTFEVWRRSARESPIGGIHTEYIGHGITRGPRLLMIGADAPLSEISNAGISLANCLAELPYMGDSLASHGASTNIVKGTLASEKINDGNHITRLTIHPQSKQLIDKFERLVKCSPAMVNAIEVLDYPNGYALNIHNIADADFLSLPASISINEDEVYFSCSERLMNEFGYLYMALHICGNFARYYPDVWLRHVEKSSSLALAIDELCMHAIDRLPLLHLSELSRVYHLISK